MKNITLQKKKVFVSYCHKDVLEEWVDKFARALGNYTIECIVDIYDLLLGQDLNYFMEKIKSEDTVKVIMLLGKNYREKANNRDGGVGVETQLISNDVYNDVEQEKFIPIVIELDEQGNAYLPHYLEGRKYIDFSDDNNFAENIKIIARAIHKIEDRPRPVVIEIPVSLLTMSTINTTPIFKYTYSESPSLTAYFDDFINSLDNYKIPNVEFNGHERIWEKIEEMNELKDNYIFVINNWFKNNKPFDKQEIIYFLETFLNKTGEYFENNTGYDEKTDHYRFLLTEIVLYTMLLLYKYRNYRMIKDLICTTFFTNDLVRNSSSFRSDIGISIFYFHLRSLNKRNEELGLNKRSLVADLMINRSNIPSMRITKEDLIEIDVLLCVLCEWFYDNVDYNWGLWVPYTCLYSNSQNKFSFINNLISKSRFENIKELFGVITEEEFLKKYKELTEKYNDTNRLFSANSFHRIPSICNLISKEKLFSLM